MIKKTFGLMKEIMSMKFPWNLWLLVLSLTNIAGGLIYISTLQGKLALLSIFLAFLIMIIIYSKKGFVKLLGLGHILMWIPLLTFFIFTLINNSPQGLFKTWLIAIIVLNGISLIIDFIDLKKYFI